MGESPYLPNGIVKRLQKSGYEFKAQSVDIIGDSFDNERHADQPSVRNKITAYSNGPFMKGSSSHQSNHPAPIVLDRHQSDQFQTSQVKQFMPAVKGGSTSEAGSVANKNTSSVIPPSILQRISVGASHQPANSVSLSNSNVKGIEQAASFKQVRINGVTVTVPRNN